MKLLSLLLAAAILLYALPAPAAVALEEVLPENILPEESPIEELPAEDSILEESPIEEPLSDALPDDALSAPMVLRRSGSGTIGPGLYFGLLHAHTAQSGGSGTPEEAFLHASQTAGLDFLALTDHSDSFDGAASACIGADAAAISEKWAAGKSAAEEATTETFVAIYGYEMSWPRQMHLGHISTFATPGFHSWQQAAFSAAETALPCYYDALASAEGSVSQFNHPGTLYGNFSGFAHYSEAADRAITLLEVGCGEGEAGGAGYFPAYEAYTQALDLGWHLAPTNNQGNHQGAWGDANTARTAVFADSLTEEGIYEALREYRVYATEDSDLEIRYCLNGYFMGSRLSSPQAGDSAEISVSVNDPTDDAVGLVEVIVEGGETAASRQVDSPSAELTFTLPPDFPYYYLKITQPDGETAVTAPIWIGQDEELGISDFACEISVPVQGEDVPLLLTLYNRENADFMVDSITLLKDGILLTQDDSLSELSAGSEVTHCLTATHDRPGSARFSVVISGMLEGSPRQYEAHVDLFFRQSSQVRDILVDGTHGNAGTGELTRLAALAAEEDIRLTVVEEEFTPDLLENCGLLLIPAPARPLSHSFLTLVRDYAAYGGMVVVCGQADSLGPGSGYLNSLLEAVGSTMALRDDEARDTVNNGGRDSLLFTPEIHPDSPWCAGITENQTYRQNLGCTVTIGSGTPLVAGRSTADSIDGDGDGSGGTEPGTVTLLAVETLPGGGTVFAAGSLFPEDAGLKEPENLWDRPSANHTIVRNLLGMAARPLPLGTIRQARAAEPGTPVRIQGHVTAGTANPYNSFPGTIYLQDDTGGIAVTGFTAEAISVGTALEITGVITSDGFNILLEYGSHRETGADFYRHQPLTGDWKTLLDPELHGGELVEAEGTCSEIRLDSDGILSEFTLTDSGGNAIRVLIEEGIASHATGENTLHKTVLEGRTLRAIGILHVNAEGEPVLRVRNCEEVVYVPPATARPGEYANPKTGDPMVFQIFHIF